VEPVDVVLPSGKTIRYPNLDQRIVRAKVDYINGCVGLSLPPEKIVEYLKRMSLDATVEPNGKFIAVKVPPTRSDILHACDVMEDVAIAYGYNNLPRVFPNTNTIAAPLPINKLSDLTRREFALAGWTEVLPLILVSIYMHR
jgi:phenylalanyl-tRNA synthetase beta chain